MKYNIPKYTLLIAVLIWGSSLPCVGSGQPVDSLKDALRNSREDSSKISTLLELVEQYRSIDMDTAILYAGQAYDVASQLKDNNRLGEVRKSQGINSYYLGEYVEALQYWEMALQAYRQADDKAGVANILSNIGAVYFNQGDNINALEYSLQALKLADQLKDSLRIATTAINIGAIYVKKESTYPEALQYYKRALKYARALEDQNALGTAAANIGEVMAARDELDSALFYLNISLDAFEGSENLPYTLTSISKIYNTKEDYDQAIDFATRAFNMASKLDAKMDMIQAAIAMASTYESLGKFQQAEEYFFLASELSKEIGANYELKDTYDGLSRVFAEEGNYREAFKYNSLYAEMKDTLYNIETDRKLSGLVFNYELDKAESEIELLNKDKELQESDLRRQKMIRNATLSGFAMVMFFLVVVMRQKKRIGIEKNRSDTLLLNILPSDTAEELKHTGKAKARKFDDVSVMFTDFKNFTQASEKLSPEELVELINHCFSEFDRIISKYNIEKIKTIGDAYMCASNLPTSNPNHARDIILAGLEMARFISDLYEAKMKEGEVFFQLRLGVHSGPVVAGIVGLKKFAYDIWGDTVNTASRMESSGAPGRVNISGTTYELVKDHFKCTYRGKVEAKNKGEVEMYFVDELIEA